MTGAAAPRFPGGRSLVDPKSGNLVTGAWRERALYILMALAMGVINFVGQIIPDWLEPYMNWVVTIGLFGGGALIAWAPGGWFARDEGGRPMFGVQPPQVIRDGVAVQPANWDEWFALQMDRWPLWLRKLFALPSYGNVLAIVLAALMTPTVMALLLKPTPPPVVETREVRVVEQVDRPETLAALEAADRARFELEAQIQALKTKQATAPSPRPRPAPKTAPVVTQAAPPPAAPAPPEPKPQAKPDDKWGE